MRVLLYRGANKEAKNKHGHTPFQVKAKVNSGLLFMNKYKKK